jgi:hypothetical protein
LSERTNKEDLGMTTELKKSCNICGNLLTMAHGEVAGRKSWLRQCAVAITNLEVTKEPDPYAASAACKYFMISDVRADRFGEPVSEPSPEQPKEPWEMGNEERAAHERQVEEERQEMEREPEPTPEQGGNNELDS